MEIIDLPLLAITTSIQAARTAMVESNRSGVVTNNGEEYWLYHASDLLRGRRLGRRTLQQLSQKRAVHTHEIFQNLALRYHGETSYQLRSQIEATLDRAGRSYGVITRFDGPISNEVARIQIVTRKESLARLVMQGPADCYCNNPNLDEPHEYSSANKPADLICPFDGTNIECF